MWRNHFDSFVFMNNICKIILYKITVFVVRYFISMSISIFISVSILTSISIPSSIFHSLLIIYTDIFWIYLSACINLPIYPHL